jgi:hypothetical protein
MTNYCKTIRLGGHKEDLNFIWEFFGPEALEKKYAVERGRISVLDSKIDNSKLQYTAYQPVHRLLEAEAADGMPRYLAPDGIRKNRFNLNFKIFS